jgi:3',5'-cyclic AMP phosphodiesterase CpdA
MKLYALSDVHLRYEANRALLQSIRPHPDDWLILCGDVGETLDHLRFSLETLGPKFARLLWVPGNHELWTMPSVEQTGPRGEAQYQQWVDLCRQYQVLTPEDPFVSWEGEGGPAILAPLFLLYDYSFAPDDVGPEKAIEWSLEEGILCTDERLLHPDPYPTKQAWCHARCDDAERRLSAIPNDVPTVLINHFPLRRDLVFIPRVPRFITWCGTRRTEDWHRRFHAKAVVSGHLHVRSTQWRDGVRFEEVSLGYPRQWRQEKTGDEYLREILPGPGPLNALAASPRYHP